MNAAMDPRVGALIREGRTIYYAHIDGAFPERDTPEAVVALLDGTEAPAAPKAGKAVTTRAYLVHVEAKFPAWNDRPEEFEVEATSARQAERMIRQRIEWDSKNDGALIVKARRA